MSLELLLTYGMYLRWCVQQFSRGETLDTCMGHQHPVLARQTVMYEQQLCIAGMQPGLSASCNLG
jgi:hypothetical protein